MCPFYPNTLHHLLVNSINKSVFRTITTTTSLCVLMDRCNCIFCSPAQHNTTQIKTMQSCAWSQIYKNLIKREIFLFYNSTTTGQGGIQYSWNIYLINDTDGSCSTIQVLKLRIWSPTIRYTNETVITSTVMSIFTSGIRVPYLGIYFHFLFHVCFRYRTKSSNIWYPKTLIIRYSCGTSQTKAIKYRNWISSAIYTTCKLVFTF